MTGQYVWNCLWKMHHETKGLLFFRPWAIMQHYGQKNVVYAEMDEKEVQLADALTDAPAEHSRRLKTSPGGVDEEEPQGYTVRQRTGLVLGPLLFFLLLFMPAPFGMEVIAKRMAAVVCLMAVWWMTEAIPIPATSLLPIVLFPLLGIMHIKQTTQPYASDLIFLFMGGFIIASLDAALESPPPGCDEYCSSGGIFPGTIDLWFYAGNSNSFCICFQHCDNGDDDADWAGDYCSCHCGR